jgi:hypothetical protein
MRKFRPAITRLPRDIGKERAWRVELLAIAALLLAMGLAGCGPKTTGQEIAEKPPSQTPTDVRQLTVAEKAALGKSLAKVLKDPDSAQFRWMPVASQKTIATAVYCGWSNGKNSYGGYTAFKPFYASITRNVKGEFYTGEITRIRDDSEKCDNEPTITFCRMAGYADMSEAN